MRGKSVNAFKHGRCNLRNLPFPLPHRRLTPPNTVIAGNKTDRRKDSNPKHYYLSFFLSAMGTGRTISQEAFEEVVKENIDDLGMDPDEALQDAIETLTLQEVDLSGNSSLKTEHPKLPPFFFFFYRI